MAASLTDGFFLAGGFVTCLPNKLSEGFTPLLPDSGGGGGKWALVAQGRIHFCHYRPPLAPLQLLILPFLPPYTEPFYVIFYWPEDVSSRCLRNVCNLLSDCTGSHPRRHSSVFHYALKSDTFFRAIFQDGSNRVPRAQWLTEGGGGGWGVQPPPPPRFQRPSKIVLNSTRLWKLLKIAEFRTPTPQYVWKKGSQILKLPRFAIVLH